MLHSMRKSVKLHQRYSTIMNCKLSTISLQVVRIEGFWPKGPYSPLAFCDVLGQEGGATSDNKKSSLFSKSNVFEAIKVVNIYVQ